MKQDMWEVLVVLREPPKLELLLLVLLLSVCTCHVVVDVCKVVNVVVQRILELSEKGGTNERGG
jgi:hypothetical protein